MTIKQFNRCVRVAQKKLAEIKKVQYRHFCFICKGTKIFVVGINSSTTHPKSNTFYKAKHAEFDALNRFKNLFPDTRIDNKSLLVIRLNNQGEIRMSKPCSSCINFIRQYNIGRVFYSNREGELEVCHI